MKSAAVALVAALSSAALALSISPPAAPDPFAARYPNGNYTAAFIKTKEEGGTGVYPNLEYNDAYLQAIDGSMIMTIGPPTRICPCHDDQYGAKNFTGYYIGGDAQEPTLQLYVDSPGPQYVYVAPDLTLRYTIPGLPPPSGANTTSIFFYDASSIGKQVAPYAGSSVRGHVTQLNGTKTYYAGLQVCAKSSDPPRTENGLGPFQVRAQPTEDNQPDGNGIVGERCVEKTFFCSQNLPAVGPYYIEFMTPSEPLVFAYEG